MKNTYLTALAALLSLVASTTFAQTVVDEIPEYAWKVYFPNLDLTPKQSAPATLPLRAPGVENPGQFKVKVEGHVGPTVNNAFTLGSEEMRWRDVYVGPNSLKVGTGRGDQAIISYSNTAGISRIQFDNDDDGDIDVSLTENGDIEFVGTLKPDNDAGDNGEILRSNGGTNSPTWVDIQTLAWSKTGNTGTDPDDHFVGTTDNNSLVFRTDNIIRASILGTTGDANEGAFVPYIDDTYSLGTPTNRWKDLYLGPSTIRIGGFINGNRGDQNPQTLDEVAISYFDNLLQVDKGLQTAGDVTPADGGTYSLGSSE